MPVMTEQKAEALARTDRLNCLCCGRRVRTGERYIEVSKSVGIQHEDACPRSRKEAVRG